MGENLRNVELSRKIFARICRIVKIHHVIFIFIAFFRCPMQLEDIIPIADGRKKLFTTKLINTLSNKRYSNFCIDLLTSSINSSKKRKMKRITFFFFTKHVKRPSGANVVGAMFGEGRAQVQNIFQTQSFVFLRREYSIYGVTKWTALKRIQTIRNN